LKNLFKQGCEKPQNGRPWTVWPKVDGGQPSRRQKKKFPLSIFPISFDNYQTIYTVFSLNFYNLQKTKFPRKCKVYEKMQEIVKIKRKYSIIRFFYKIDVNSTVKYVCGKYV